MLQDLGIAKNYMVGRNFGTVRACLVAMVPFHWLIQMAISYRTCTIPKDCRGTVVERNRYASTFAFQNNDSKPGRFIR